MGGSIAHPDRTIATADHWKWCQFSTDEVFIREVGEDVILSPRPRDWRTYLESGLVASNAFMDDAEDLPVQEREGWRHASCSTPIRVPTS
jgi:virulence-associated protein VagC